MTGSGPHSEFNSYALRASHSFCPHPPRRPLLRAESPAHPPAAHAEGVHHAFQVLQLVSSPRNPVCLLSITQRIGGTCFPSRLSEPRHADTAFNFSRRNLDSFLEGSSSGSSLSETVTALGPLLGIHSQVSRNLGEVDASLSFYRTETLGITETSSALTAK